MTIAIIIIIFVFFIAVMVFNDPLNKRYHSYYEDQQQEIADKLYGDSEKGTSDVPENTK